MPLPNISHFDLRNDILRESDSNDRLILWVPGDRGKEFQNWERFSNITRTDVIEHDDLCTMAAMLVPLRQSFPSFWDKVRARLKSSGNDGSWITPEGHPAEPTGRKQTDLMLVWPKDSDAALTEDQIRQRWPNCDQCRRLGANLFVLIGGIEAHDRPSETNKSERLHAREEHFDELSRPENNPHNQADATLTAARISGDREQEVIALTDLGAVLVRHDDAAKGVEHLEQALVLARQSEDSECDYDVLTNLAIGYLAIHNLPRSVELLQQVLGRARSRQDPFTEKMMLNHLGSAGLIAMEPQRALEFFDSASTIARTLGDRRDEAELAWSIAVCHDELGQRDAALLAAQASVQIFRELESPQAITFSEQLERFQRSAEDSRLSDPAAPGLHGSPPWNAGESIDVGSTASGGPAGRPSLLRMAYTATRSMTKFLASGFKTVSREANVKRLQVCRECEHHTGVRCKLCGCFTAQKAWLPHEHCPAGKWPV